MRRYRLKHDQQFKYNKSQKTYFSASRSRHVEIGRFGNFSCKAKSRPSLKYLTSSSASCCRTTACVGPDGILEHVLLQNKYYIDIPSAMYSNGLCPFPILPSLSSLSHSLQGTLKQVHGIRWSARARTYQ